MNQLIPGIPRSYAQIMFSYNPIFGLMLLGITFINPVVGFYGLFATVVGMIFGVLLGFNREELGSGTHTFNAMLLGCAAGYFLPFSWRSTGVLLVLTLLTVMLTKFLQYIFQIYLNLSPLTFPFVLGGMMLLLIAGGVTAIQLKNSVLIGEPLPYTPWDLFLLTTGMIFFQGKQIAGWIMLGVILCYSRILFLLIFAGFWGGIGCYWLFAGVESSTTALFVGINAIFVAVAIGGVFLIPSIYSILFAITGAIISVPLTIALEQYLLQHQLPVFILPFVMIVTMMIIALRQRDGIPRGRLVTFSPGRPEENLNYFLKNSVQFKGAYSSYQVGLPLKGMWQISQGFQGEETHRERWQHALDFQKLTGDGLLYSGDGNECRDYPTFGASIYAPVSGHVITCEGSLEDNDIGEMNSRDNWGNYVIIQADYGFFITLAHLQKGSLAVSPNQKVHRGDLIARGGNSGRSLYPHLHFQVQKQGVIGGDTRPFSIDHYILQGDGDQVMSGAIPQKGDIISPMSVDEGLKEAFALGAGRQFQFQSGEEKISVTSEVDLYGNRYLHNIVSGEKLFFHYDQSFIYFTDYQRGKRGGLLYTLYKNLPSIPLQFTRGLIWEDSRFIPRGGVKKVVDDLLHLVKKPILMEEQFHFGPMGRYRGEIVYQVQGDRKRFLFSRTHFLLKMECGDVVIEQVLEGEG